MKSFDSVYIIGIGGIGTSALARYFASEGYPVAGYDRTPSPLTAELESEGIDIHYTDDVTLIDPRYKHPGRTLVIYTPAVPHDMGELTYYRDGGYDVLKRSEVLGVVTEGKYCMAVAGTHGKSSTTTMLAWFNACAADDGDGTVGSGSAFMGGISKNFGSNIHLGGGRRVAVEADEFDRSFLRLHPDVALISSTDADHLDIYGTHEALREGFSLFAGQIKKGGALVVRKGVTLPRDPEGVSLYTYSSDDDKADFHAVGCRADEQGRYMFDIVCPDRTIKGCHLGIPGRVNVENCVGAVAMMWVAGFDEDRLREAIESFRGVKRRMDVQYHGDDRIYIDDYAHHPEELRRTICSVREMFPGKSVTAVFQPHLYTRTRDFADDFARSLSAVDRLIMLPIYPAREEPIEGVDSRMILDAVTAPEKSLVGKEELLDVLRADDGDVLITFGAGDIDRFVELIREMLEKR